MIASGFQISGGRRGDLRCRGCDGADARPADQAGLTKPNPGNASSGRGAHRIAVAHLGRSLVEVESDQFHLREVLVWSGGVVGPGLAAREVALRHRVEDAALLGDVLDLPAAAVRHHAAVVRGVVGRGLGGDQLHELRHGHGDVPAVADQPQGGVAGRSVDVDAARLVVVEERNEPRLAVVDQRQMGDAPETQELLDALRTARSAWRRMRVRSVRGAGTEALGRAAACGPGVAGVRRSGSEHRRGRSSPGGYQRRHPAGRGHR